MHSEAKKPRAAKKAGLGVRVIGVLGEVVLTLGVLLLLFVAWELWYTNLSADRQVNEVTHNIQQQFTEELGQESGLSSEKVAQIAAEAAAAPENPDSAEVKKQSLADRENYGKPPKTSLSLQGQTFGIMYVPRFGAHWSRPITNGVGQDVLNNLGVGHYQSTAMPGELGNFAVAAHRQTHGQAFWDMDKLRAGDRIYVQTNQGYYTYKWSSTDIVLPSQNQVLDPVPYQEGKAPTEAILTMTTCHPPYTTEKRMVAFSTLESWRPLDAGPPPEIARTVATTMGRG